MKQHIFVWRFLAYFLTYLQLTVLQRKLMKISFVFFSVKERLAILTKQMVLLTLSPHQKYVNTRTVFNKKEKSEGEHLNRIKCCETSQGELRKSIKGTITALR